MIESVLILGGGSAGFLAALALRTRVPRVKVTVVRSKEIGVIGVGESTVPGVVNFLHGYLKLDPTHFLKTVGPVWKLGIRFLWGPQPFFDYPFGSQLGVNYSGLSRHAAHYVGKDFNDVGPTTALMTRCKAFMRRPDGTPDLGPPIAYHLENVRFVAWLEEYARRMEVEIIDGMAADVQAGESGVTGITLSDGRKLAADLYVDASGFRSMLLGKALEEPYISFASTLFCNSAVTGGWKRQPGEAVQPYTTAETMEAGWCWQIDHDTCVNRGYVFSSDFLSDEEAEKEFRRKNPRVEETKFIRFKSGRYQRAWVKNVVGLGNANGFVEPLESTAIMAFCMTIILMTHVLEATECRPTSSWLDIFNQSHANRWDAIRRFLAIHYRYNTRLDNEFWRACREKVNLAGAEKVVAFYQENGPQFQFQNYLLEKEDIFPAEGYLSLLQGMCVPCKSSFVSGGELARWEKIRRQIGATADRGFDYEEAIRLFTSPQWVWPEGWHGRTY